MKIIIVLQSLELGGAERQALFLARFLQERTGAHVEIWGGGEGNAAAICDEMGVSWRIVPCNLRGSFAHDFIQVIDFLKALRIAKPDVILPYTLVPNILCGLIWKFTGARLCVWNQRDDGLGLSRKRLYHKLAVKNCSLFLSNSLVGKNALVEEFLLDPRAIQVVHNGIELAHGIQSGIPWRRQLNICQDTFIACMVANLHVNKDHATLIKAWRKVVNVLSHLGRSFTLLLAGRYDNTYASLKTLVADLDLMENVLFLGNVSNIPELLNAVDLCVHSSLREGCPNGVLESMAAGLPVAATDIPGIREAVGPAAYQYLAKPHDAEALADIISTFAQNKALCVRVGTANRLRAQTEFKIESMCSRTVAVIRQGIGDL